MKYMSEEYQKARAELLAKPVVKRFRKGDIVRGEKSGNLYRIIRKHTQKITYDNYDVSWLVENLATGEQRRLRDTYLVLETRK